MSARSQKARLGRLPKLTADRVLCIHHGDLCGIGTQPLPEFYLMVLNAKRRAGQDVPPLNEHRAMTSGELADYDRRLGEKVAAKEAENERRLAALLAEGSQP